MKRKNNTHNLILIEEGICICHMLPTDSPHSAYQRKFFRDIHKQKARESSLCYLSRGFRRLALPHLPKTSNNAEAHAEYVYQHLSHPYNYNKV